MNTKSLPQMLFGILVLGVGVGFLLDNLNVVNFASIAMVWWPMVIVFIGLASLISNPRVFVWPLFIVGGGVLLQLRELEIVHFSVWSILWPIAIIFAGLSILFEKLGPGPRATNDDKINAFVAFSGIDNKNHSSNFSGGKITALFGGVSIDMREAQMKKDATIDVFTAFGGVDLKVPETWHVETGGLPLMGGWDNQTKKPADKNAPVLRINGTCIFGGVEVRN